MKMEIKNSTRINGPIVEDDDEQQQQSATARHLLLGDNIKQHHVWPTTTKSGPANVDDAIDDERPCATELQLKAADTIITIRGYRRRSLAIVALVWLLIVLSCGALGVIILYWKPAWFLKLTHKPCSLATATMIYIKDAYNQHFVRRMFTATTAEALHSASHIDEKKEMLVTSLHDIKEAYEGKDEAVLPADASQKIQLLSDEGVIETHDKLRYFHFQKRTYWFDARTKTFVPLVGPASFRRSTIDPKCGLSDSDAHQRYQLYGKNEITIRVHSYLRTLVLEALNPFYFFQAFSVTVWLFDSYYIFSCCLLIMSCLSLGYTTWQTRRMQQVRHERFESSGTVLVVRHKKKPLPSSALPPNKKHEEASSYSSQQKLQPRQQNLNSSKYYRSSQTTLTPTAESSCLTLDNSENTENNHRHVSISAAAEMRLKNGVGSINFDDNQSRRSNPTSYRRRLSSRMYAGSHVRSINSKELVPGDIILIPQQGCEMYCDAIILNGACIVNESTLTGESVPVTKLASVDDEDDEDDGEDKESALDEEEEEEAPRQHTISSERLFYVAPNTTKNNNSTTNGGLGGDTKKYQQNTASSKCVLYSGTTVIQTRYYGNEPVKAVVMRTGFATVKGELVRSILYPKPVDFLFYMEAYKFLGALSVLAFIGLVYSLFILLWRARSFQGAVIRSLGLITTVVPPTLPLALTLGIVYAQKRLKRAGLFCISPRMINMAGSINVCCFDKTGTLTEEGLNLRGVVPVHEVKSAADEAGKSGGGSIRRLSSLVTDTALAAKQSSSSSADARNTDIYKCMATCHALTLIDGKLSGDPLDLEMFHATGWQLDEPDMDVEEDAINNNNNTAPTQQPSNNNSQLRPTVVRPPSLTTAAATAADNRKNEISIVRILPFESQLQRMSVLVVDASFTCCLYCKGSPEMIASLCDADSVPENFQKVLSQYTQQGHRVLALARRTFDNDTTVIRQKNVDPATQLQRTRRFKLERNLEFLGLLVFENRLKPETIGCIRELKEAFIRPIMITGDNLLTALSVARQCGIIDTDAVMLYDTAGAGGALNKTIISTKPSTSSSSPVRNGGQRDDNNNNGLVRKPAEEDDVENEAQEQQCSALTGDMFAIIRSKFTDTEYAQRVLRRGAVFARMSPPQKEMLVEDLRHAGYFVGMCGDGANDCSALRTAHMGISLSDQEASAAAPFTYKHANVSCVPTCIREGRAALDTSFGAFKYMAAYSLTQFFSVLLLYWLNTNLGAYEFLYIDLFEVTLIIFVFGTTHAYTRLVRTTPPTRLLAIGPLTSLLGQVVLVLTFQMLAYFLVQQQTWYKNIVSQNAGYNANSGSHNDESYYSYENYAVYCVSSFQYIWLAVAFSRGFPYRRAFFTNWRLVSLCLALAAFDIYVTLAPCTWLVRMFELALPPTWTFRWVLVCISISNLAAAILLEWVLVAWLNRKLEQRRQRHRRSALQSDGRSNNNNDRMLELNTLPAKA